MKLLRHPANPILEPIPGHPWESRNVCNCGVITHDGKIVLIYRAQGGESNVSRLGYTESTDGLHFERRPEPVFAPETPEEIKGVEDPRLTVLDGRVQMLYTAWSPESIPWRCQVARASTTDFRTWQRHGIVIPGPDNKDAAIFPAKVAGRYVAFHRIPPSIWIARSDDLDTWGDEREIMKPRPLEARGGRAADPDRSRLARDLSRCRPRAGLSPRGRPARPGRPVPGPQPAGGAGALARGTWELTGEVPNVVFTCGIAELGDDYLVYYGGADRVIGLATANKRDLLDFAAHG